MMKKRIISLLLAMVLAVGGMSVAAFAEGDAVTLSVDPTEGYYPGSQFTVTVNLSEAGYVALLMESECSANLSLESVEVLSGLGGFPVPYEGSLIWANFDPDIDFNEQEIVDTTYTGNVIKLTYKIADDAAVGAEASVSVAIEAVNLNGEHVIDETATTSIKVEERPYIVGDIYVDGVPCDLLDIQKACMIFMGLEELDCAPEAADVYKDGNYIDILDIQKLCMVFMGLESL